MSSSRLNRQETKIMQTHLFMHRACRFHQDLVNDVHVVRRRQSFERGVRLVGGGGWMHWRVRIDFETIVPGQIEMDL